MKGSRPHSLKTRAVNGALSAGGGQLIRFAIKLGTLAVLARFLTPADYGLVALVTAITSVLRLFQDAGLSTATLQAREVTHLQSSSMYWLNVGLGGLLFLLTVLLGPVAAQLYNHPEMTLLFPCFGLAAFITSFRAQRVALMQRDLQFHLQVVSEIVADVLSSALGIGLAMVGAGLWCLPAIEISQRLFSNLLLFLFHDWRPAFRFSYPEIRPFLRFGSSIMGANAVARATQGFDALVVGSFLGAAPLGLYNRAQNLLHAPINQFVSPLSAVARAAIFRTASEPARFTRSVTAVLQIIALGGALIVLLSLSLAPQIVGIVLGPAWVACVPLFMALMPFAMVEPCSVFLHSVLIAKGEGSALLKWKLANAGLVLGSLLIGLPWGVLGVALSYGLGGLLLRFPLLFVYASRKTEIPFRTLIGSVAPTTGACAVAAMAAVYRNVHQPNLGPLQALGTVAIVLSLFAALTLLSPGPRAALTGLRRTAADRLRSFGATPAPAVRLPHVDG